MADRADDQGGATISSGLPDSGKATSVGPAWKVGVWLLRLGIFLLSLLLTGLIPAISMGLAGVAFLLFISKKEILLSAETLPLYPSWLYAMEVPQWAAPWYAAGAILLLLAGLPLCLAFLEKAWLAFR
ncbi:MAG: hypothetical protein ACLFUS_02900 [Candidatus Sumerlaeia bacterium]